MTDIARLADKWRREAERLFAVSSNDVDMRPTLNMCADELDQAWHEYAHDAAWETDGSCRLCDAERGEEGS